jgi:large subunit ribosomal protein L22
MKTIIAKAKFVPSSPRKLRLVADAVRGLPINAALNYLKLMPQAAARPLMLVLQQAVGNAKDAKLSVDQLSVSSLQIEEGPRFKRRDVHAHGARFDSGVRKRKTAHIVIQLKEQNSKIKN